MKHDDKAKQAWKAYHDANVRLMKEQQTKKKRERRVAFVAKATPTYTREQWIDDLVEAANKYCSG